MGDLKKIMKMELKDCKIILVQKMMCVHILL